MRRIWLVSLLAVALSGCIKAQYLPNPNGGWTLVTEVETVDQAAIRFRRTAHDLCGAGPYRMGEIQLMNTGYKSEQTVRVDLTCGA